jgi:uncharacterized Zn finger protein (UPF0148 family)
MATANVSIPTACPACGMTDTSARTSGPTVCANCGHRDPAAWAEQNT